MDIPIANVIRGHVQLLLDQPSPAGLEFAVYRTIVDTSRLDWSDPEYDHYYKVPGVAKWTVWRDGDNVHTWDSIWVEGLPLVDYEQSLSYCSAKRFLEHVRPEVLGLVGRLTAQTDQRAKEKLLSGVADRDNHLLSDHQIDVPMRIWVDADFEFKNVWRVLPDGSRKIWHRFGQTR